MNAATIEQNDSDNLVHNQTNLKENILRIEKGQEDLSFLKTRKYNTNGQL